MVRYIPNFSFINGIRITKIRSYELLHNPISSPFDYSNRVRLYTIQRSSVHRFLKGRMLLILFKEAPHNSLVNNPNLKLF